MLQTACQILGQILGTAVSHAGFGKMRRTSLLVLALLAGCAKGPAADLQYIKQARSIAAEWALVNQQSEERRVTATYVDSMHRWLRQGAQTADSSLTDRKTAYGREIEALLAEPPAAAPSRLRAHAQRLKQFEDRLESA
jgi:hypothetical protein